MRVEMRLSLVIISFVLLAGLAFGVSRAFALPTETREQIPVLNYQHRGEFDYLVRQGASYLFGDIPLEAAARPPSALKYPTEIIDRFDMSFTYAFVPGQYELASCTAEVEVRAALRKPGEALQEVILVPRTTKTGDFTVDFCLDARELALSPTTRVTADVYTTAETEDSGPIFESFTQSLTIQSEGPLLQVDTSLASTQPASFGEVSYEQRGEFDYSVLLDADSPWGAITIRSPSTPSSQAASAKTLGPGETIFTNLFDGMEVTFSYRFESDRPVKEIAEQVEVNAVLENPGVWKKTFALVPLTDKSGPFTVSFTLDNNDFSRFQDVYKSIAGETGSSTPHQLTITASVHTVADTDSGVVDEDFSQSLSTVLGGNTLEWEEELVHSKPGSIETTEVVRNQERYLGLPVTGVRILSATVTAILLILFGFSLWLYLARRPERPTGVERQAERAANKYKDLMVDIEELPEAKPGETVISLDSLDDLIRAAQGFLKPVLHKAEEGRHTYCVIDGATRYQYLLKVNKG